MNHRVTLAWAGALGASGVILGSLGAHPLKSLLEASGTREAWQTAATYQLLHAAALLGFAGWMRDPSPSPGPCAAWAVRLWVIGTLLFSGSVYCLSLGVHGLGIVTPLGGMALIAGWVLAAFAALPRK
jgi:uncharacterized membrane protein YgdD (TMEM256/DUF423 family)